MFVCVSTGIAGYILLGQSSPVQIGPTPTPIVLKFEGAGDKVVFFDSPTSGAGLIGLGHKGDRNFIVNLSTSNGKFIDQFANEIGDYQGEKVLTVDQGSYMLEITADGQWFVVVLPPQEYQSD